jgi:shikimate kinase
MKIYLIGFMGSGKTFLGRKLAELLRVPFFDLDNIIEEQYKRSITEIFQTEGEDFFRKIESELLRNWNKEGVIATGGGIIKYPDNREIFQEDNCITIWLNPAWQEILSTLEGSDNRPMFNDLSEQKLLELWNYRSNLYKECADIVINDPEVNKILSAIKLSLKLLEIN